MLECDDGTDAKKAEPFIIVSKFDAKSGDRPIGNLLATTFELAGVGATLATVENGCLDVIGVEVVGIEVVAVIADGLATDGLATDGLEVDGLEVDGADSDGDLAIDSGSLHGLGSCWSMHHARPTMAAETGRSRSLQASNKDWSASWSINRGIPSEPR